jgi:uncharacterized membrane protein YeaQ/YmgE (transglycosylase-associated protein family)
LAVPVPETGTKSKRGWGRGANRRAIPPHPGRPKIVKGSGSGILMNIVIGIIGALIGGFLLSFWFDTAEGGWWFTLFTAILGSVILLWVVGMVQKRT